MLKSYAEGCEVHPTPALTQTSHNQLHPPALRVCEEEEDTRPRKCVTFLCLKTCDDQLFPTFTRILNSSLDVCEVHSCFKHSTIILDSKKPYYRN